MPALVGKVSISLGRGPLIVNLWLRLNWRAMHFGTLSLGMLALWMLDLRIVRLRLRSRRSGTVRRNVSSLNAMSAALMLFVGIPSVLRECSHQKY